MIKVSKITEKDAVKVMKDLTSAVKVLHDEGILNGSLKISSFWYDLNSECLKLVDFSKSIIIRDQNPIKLNFLSNYYTAPESINGQISLKVDIWSLGVIFYILLAGRPPFYSKSQELLFHKILTQDLDFPNDFSPDVKDLLKKMLSKDPETRFSITQVIEHDCFKSQVLESSEIPDFQPLENIHLIDPQAKDLNCFFYFVANHLINPVHHEKAKKIFKLLDADHDGVLTVRDLELSCEKFQLQINVKTFFEKVDLSQDQRVSFSDFLFGVIDKEMIKTPEILLNAFNSLKILESRIFSPLVKNFNGLIKSDPFRSSCLLGENSEVSRFLTISEFLRLFS
jgi:calcium-dependent protein kinase